MLRKIWGTRRARIITSASALTFVIAATTAGIAVANTVVHNDALAQAQAAIDGATAAKADATSSAAELDELAGNLRGATEAITPLLEPLAGLLDAGLIDELRKAVDDATTSVDDATAHRAPKTEIPKLQDDLSTDQLRELATDADKAATTWSGEEDELEHQTSLLQDSADQVDKALTAAADAAPDAGVALLAALPSADDTSKGNLTAAAEAVPDADDAVTAFQDFIAAADAAKAAHAAEEARKAEEAAQAAQGTGGRSGSGSRGGGSSGGGGGGGGGGSTGGGGGGGSTPPVDTSRHVDPRGPYTPGCALGGLIYTADPGPGGTSIIGSVPIPYDFRIDGVWVKVYACQ